MERIFYATDYSSFSPSAHGICFPDGADFCADFAAYLTTDLIQPGIINVVRDFVPGVRSCAGLGPVSIWQAEWRCNGFWGRYPTGLAAGQC